MTALFITHNYSSTSKCIRLQLKYYTDISFDFYFISYIKRNMLSDLNNNALDVFINNIFR